MPAHFTGNATAFGIDRTMSDTTTEFQPATLPAAAPRPAFGRQLVDAVIARLRGVVLAASHQAPAGRVHAGFGRSHLSPVRGRPEKPDRFLEAAAGIGRDPAARPGRVQPLFGVRGRRPAVVSADACGIEIPRRCRDFLAGRSRLHGDQPSGASSLARLSVRWRSGLRPGRPAFLRGSSCHPQRCPPS